MAPAYDGGARRARRRAGHAAARRRAAAPGSRCGSPPTAAPTSRASTPRRRCSRTPAGACRARDIVQGDLESLPVRRRRVRRRSPASTRSSTRPTRRGAARGPARDRARAAASWRWSGARRSMCELAPHLAAPRRADAAAPAGRARAVRALAAGTRSQRLFAAAGLEVGRDRRRAVRTFAYPDTPRRSPRLGSAGPCVRDRRARRRGRRAAPTSTLPRRPRAPGRYLRDQQPVPLRDERARGRLRRRGARDTRAGRPLRAPRRRDQLGGHDVLDDVAHRLVDGDLVARSVRPGARPSRTSPSSVAASGSQPCSSAQPTGGGSNASRVSTNSALAGEGARQLAVAAGGSRPS